jgi:hypothetical protein
MSVVELAHRPLRFWRTHLAPAVGFARLTSERWSATSSRARGEFVCVVEQRHFYALEYPGRKPDCIKFNTLIERAKAT